MKNKFFTTGIFLILGMTILLMIIPSPYNANMNTNVVNKVFAEDGEDGGGVMMEEEAVMIMEVEIVRMEEEAVMIMEVEIVRMEEEAVMIMEVEIVRMEEEVMII